MKKINLFSRLWSSGGNSQSSDVGYDCRLTVGSPSGLESSTLLKFVSVLVLILTIGVGNVWGASESINANSGVYSGSGNSGIHTWTMTSCTVVQAKGTGTSVNSSYPNRWYQNNLITFTPKSGYTISKIELNGSSGSYNGQTMTVTSGGGSISKSSNKSTWTGSTTSAITIKMGSQFRFGTVTITYSAGASKTLSSIAITTAPTTTKYLDGETFSKSGAVVRATYSDATTADVSSSATWNKTTLTTSDTQVTASYTEGGVTKTANQSINVYAVTVQKKDEDGTPIADAGVSASATGRSLTASVGSTHYVFHTWKFGTASGTSISNATSATTGALTGTPSAAVTVIAEFYRPCTVTWSVSGNTSTISPTTNVTHGTTVSMPTPSIPVDCTGSTFMGWTTSANASYSGDSAPSPLYNGTSPAITGDITFYAVFADED